jgi:F-type H+-transporting ATPase subunit alpha
MKTATGTLKSDLQQFRELQAFAAFGSDLDAVSKAQLERGYRLTELLKQGLNSPMPVEEQVVVIYAGTRGFLDGVPTPDVGRFEQELLEWFRSRHAGMLDEVRSGGAIGDEAAFDAAVRGFAEQFRTTQEAEGAAPDAEEQGAASSRIVDSDTTLPEEEISREDEA